MKEKSCPNLQQQLTQYSKNQRWFSATAASCRIVSKGGWCQVAWVHCTTLTGSYDVVRKQWTYLGCGLVLGSSCKKCRSGHIVQLCSNISWLCNKIVQLIVAVVQMLHDSNDTYAIFTLNSKILFMIEHNNLCVFILLFISHLLHVCYLVCQLLQSLSVAFME